MKNTITLICCLSFVSVQAQEISVWYDTTQMKHIYLDAEPIGFNVKVYNGTQKEICFMGGAAMLTYKKEMIELLNPNVFSMCGSTEKSYIDCVSELKKRYAWEAASEDIVLPYLPCNPKVCVKPKMTTTLSLIYFNLINENYGKGIYRFKIPTGDYIFYPRIFSQDGVSFLTKQEWNFTVKKSPQNTIDKMVDLEHGFNEFKKSLHVNNTETYNSSYPNGMNLYIYGYMDTCQSHFFIDKAASYIFEYQLRTQSDLDLYVKHLDLVQNQNILFYRLNELIEFIAVGNYRNRSTNIPTRLTFYTQLLKMLKKKNEVLAQSFFSQIHTKEIEDKCKSEMIKGKEYLLTDAQLSELEAICK